MTRAARFKEADVARALRAAVKAGLKPSEYVIDPNGTIRVLVGDTPVVALRNPLDRVLKR